MIIGAAKAGTTTLHALLSGHPEIFMPEEKDFKYFDNDENYTKGDDWYKAFFRNYNGQKIVGEANSEYMFSQAAVSRIYEKAGPRTRLIAIVRNPAERSYSEYLHQVRYARTDLDFETFMNTAVETGGDSEDELSGIIFGRSRYAGHLKPFVEKFGKDNVLLVVLEKLKRNPDQELSRIFRFLSVNESHKSRLLRANKAYQPRYHWLNNLILQPNSLRRMARKMIPFFSLRNKIRKKIKSLNTANDSANLQLGESRKKILMEQVFPNERKELERLFELRIEEWISD
nr:sulfotransferase domain-containing protein [Robiginitalea sp. SC105]